MLEGGGKSEKREKEKKMGERGRGINMYIFRDRWGEINWEGGGKGNHAPAENGAEKERRRRGRGGGGGGVGEVGR